MGRCCTVRPLIRDEQARVFAVNAEPSNTDASINDKPPQPEQPNDLPDTQPEPTSPASGRPQPRPFGALANYPPPGSYGHSPGLHRPQPRCAQTKLPRWVRRGVAVTPSSSSLSNPERAIAIGIIWRNNVLICRRDGANSVGVGINLREPTDRWTTAQLTPARRSRRIATTGGNHEHEGICRK